MKDKIWKVMTPVGWVYYDEYWEANETARLYGGRVYQNDSSTANMRQ